MGLPKLPKRTRGGYINLSSQLHSMPEVWSMPPKAFVVWVYGLCWASQMRSETGWTIPHEVAKTFSTTKDREALIRHGFWNDCGLYYELPRATRRGVPLWKPGASGLVRRAIPRRIRDEVFNRDGNQCLRCGSSAHLTLDHIKHWSRGGGDNADNLRTLCRSCNSQRRDKTDEEWLGRAI